MTADLTNVISGTFSLVTSILFEELEEVVGTEEVTTVVNDIETTDQSISSRKVTQLHYQTNSLSKQICQLHSGQMKLPSSLAATMRSTVSSSLGFTMVTHRWLESHRLTVLMMILKCL